MRAEEKKRALQPLVERCHLGHCWKKTADGPRRIAEPFDAAKLNQHAAGVQAYGLCPIAPGTSTTRVALFDFDSHKGEVSLEDMIEHAERVQAELRLASTLFTSSGGKGIHLYIVWDEPQDAYSVRQYMKGVLERCGFKPGTAGVAKGEVEVFPKQDAVPADGFGSMFILPFAGASQPLLNRGEALEWEPARDVPVLEKPVRERVVSETSDADLARLKSALNAIPNEGSEELDYDAWRNIVFGVHHATGGSDEGLALVHDFSSRSSKYDPDFIDDRVWPYIRSDRDGNVVTDRSVFTRASAAGWADPSVLDAFDVLDAPAAGSDSGVEGAALAPVGAAGGNSVARYRFISSAEYRARPRPNWLIRGVIPQAQLVVLFGDSGSGKSFIALDMAACIAAGRPWRDRPVQQGNVGYVVAEGSGGFQMRLVAFEEHHRTTLDRMAFLDKAPSLLEASDVRDLIHAMRAWGRMSLIIVDTLAQATAGGNENSGEDMGRALTHCKTIHAVTGATVMLIHHSGKDASKGARGWSGLRAAADAELEVLRVDQERVLTVTKQKDGEDGASYGFRLLPVPVGLDEDDQVVTSCVVEHTDGDRQAVLAAPDGVNEKRVWEAALELQGINGMLPSVNDVLELAVSRAPRGESKRDKRRGNMDRAYEGLKSKGKLSELAGRVAVAGVQKIADVGDLA